MAKTTVKDQIAAAVAAALAAAKPVAPSIGEALIAATTPVAAAPVLTGRALYESLLSPSQADACEEFIAYAKEAHAKRLALTEQADAIVARMFPSPTDKDTWLAVAADIARELGGKDSDTTSYGRKVLVDAYKRKHAALPTKGKTVADALPQGMSAKRYANGFRTKVDAVIEYAANFDKLKIDAATLLMVENALDAMDKAATAFKAAA
jgi:hypothetical protein